MKGLTKIVVWETGLKALSRLMSCVIRTVDMVSPSLPRLG